MNLNKWEYDLSISFNRHGPKETLEWPLSENWKKIAEETYSSLPNSLKWENIYVESSPIHRTIQTADIFIKKKKKKGIKVISFEQDERLSEGDIAHYPELAEKLWWLGWKRVKKWIERDDFDKKQFPNIKTWKEAIMWFCDRILDKINFVEKQKSKKEDDFYKIDCFTHAPLMLGFLLMIQEKTGTNLLPKNREEDKIFNNLLKYLSSFSLHFSSLKEDVFWLEFNKNVYSIKRDIIKQISDYLKLRISLSK